MPGSVYQDKNACCMKRHVQGPIGAEHLWSGIAHRLKALRGPQQGDRLLASDLLHGPTGRLMIQNCPVCHFHITVIKQHAACQKNTAVMPLSLSQY